MKISKKIIIFLCFVLAIEIAPLSYNFIVATSTSNVSKDWGLGYSTPGTIPTGHDTQNKLQEYNTYYVDVRDEKNVYLTFDAGYENGFTNSILDTLKQKNVPATFFLVGNFFKTNPEIVKRMCDEGHIVGNHTINHLKMSTVSDITKFNNELLEIEKTYEGITHKKMKKFFRPPSGNYSYTCLERVKKLGYTTVLWSVAYVDWYDKNQPSHDEAYSKIMGRLHPGAIILLHSTSKTNSEVLGNLIDKIRAEGYTFRSLDYLKSS